ncbi:MAG: AbrB/MazE/SpoVT family DNA-binding domain-containing protein [Lamprocystis purpurea]|jgi:antitoxin VapB|uniref:antitoxin n=1 Tax=Lamprocystis purpurea TaxID=61598 RepID=UPI00037DC3EB|nr:AbrB/MazE/SpoVT family DNA-binding domain-containing protein [Lamprocystis purpurea]MBV5274048.1 AbrB/MazE/SpoVT family DNA-binding domain-containing protein [Lamprocystis purpurea]
MQPQRHVRLFRNGRTQTLRIPHEFELDADEATIRRDGERLIVEPVKRRPDLASLLAGWEPLDEPFPDVDEGLLPLDDIRL